MPNTPPNVSSLFTSTLKVPHCDCHECYSGFLIESGDDFLHGKKNSFQLAVVGKEVLLKSCYPIPTYAMSCSKLPLQLGNKIQSLMAKFWWGLFRKGSKKNSLVELEDALLFETRRWYGISIFHQFWIKLCCSKQAWNLQVLQGDFSSEDVKKIKALPISPRPYWDRLVWYHSKEGTYTVKTGYWLADFFENHASCSNPSVTQS